MDFNQLFQEQRPENTIGKEALLEGIKPPIQEVLGATSQYHPIYKLDHVFGASHREELLRFDCEQVLAHYSNYHARELQKIRILDIGCFFGFTTLTLAETFPRIVGMDTNPRYVQVCNDLAAYHSSPARFLNLDLFDHKLPDHVVDCVLFFNILHQVIFHRGLAYTKSYLGYLSKVVDVIFFELATADEYREVKTENPLPEDPFEVLQECSDCDIQFIQSKQRPFYKVQRKRLQYYTLPVERIYFRGSFHGNIDKKNYLSDNSFLKVFRRGEADKKLAENEYNGLHRVRQFEISPYPYEIWHDGQFYSVLMQRIDGTNLRIHSQQHPQDPNRPQIVRKMMRIMKVLAENDVHHNDLSIQNFIMTEEGKLYLLDYEHFAPHPVYDNFAFLLWNLNDWYLGFPNAVERDIFPKLILKEGETRVSRELYPDPAALPLEPEMAPFFEDALTAESWLEFTRRWAAEE